MWPSVDSLSLTSNVFTILRDLIHERTGLYYDDEKRTLLGEKLALRVHERGFATFLDYYYLLKYGPDSEAEWPYVLDALSVQETYFCREMTQIETLANVILPTYVAENPTRPIEIWCAACATGEEPLTIAIMLQEKGWFDRVPLRIHASDASQAAISKARRGIYRDRAFRAIPQSLQSKYFTAVESGWQIDAQIHRRVSFVRANLMNSVEIDALARVPFVFCRNVFIYFSEETIAQTISEFAKRMIRPGYLFVGASESLLKLTADFELRTVGDAFAYVLA